MKYFINRIDIENFKFIKQAKIDFKKSNLVMLDGPNGYGKTTIFDIIELVITGKIDRINSNQTDNASGCTDILYLKDQSKDAVIKVEFVSKEKCFTVVKKIDCNKRYMKKDKKSNNWNLFDTYLLENFNGEYNQDNKIETNKIIELFGEADLERFYNLFYYVQQEDSSVFLKKNEKDRVKILSKLFDTEKEEKELEKLEKFRQKINEQISNLEKYKKTYDDIILNKDSIKKVEYKRIVKWKNIDWDKEELIIDSKKQLDEHKVELENIKIFKNNFDQFYKFNLNSKIDFYIDNENVLKSYIICKNFFNQYNQIKKTYENMKFILSAKDIFTNMSIDKVNQFNYKRLFDLINPQDRDVVVKKYEQYIEKLNTLKKNESNLEAKVSSLNKAREFLHPNNLNKELDIKYIKNDQCILCGNPCTTKDKLVGKIDNYTKYLEEIVGESYVLNKDASETIKNIISDQIIKYINDYTMISSNIIDEEFYIQLNEYIKIYQKNIVDNSIVEYMDIDTNIYINTKPEKINDLDEKYQQLNEYIMSKIYPIKEEYITLDKDINFNNIYKLIFDMKKECVEKINLNQIDEKISYISARYYNNELSKQVYNKNIDKKISKLKAMIDNQIKPSIELYRKNIRNHHTKIIKDIEIPFYIYSGKIIQDYQRGLGVFIKEYKELKNLKFVSNNNSDHDAINYLSSGQLSSLVISFTLALNKVYGNKNINTILIDDPVQTMDDINMMSFIELIRNEFEDKQIIISTHEDEISLFMRYKFLMYGLKETRVNVKSVLR